MKIAKARNEKRLFPDWYGMTDYVLAGTQMAGKGMQVRKRLGMVVQDNLFASATSGCASQSQIARRDF